MFIPSLSSAFKIVSDALKHDTSGVELFKTIEKYKDHQRIGFDDADLYENIKVSDCFLRNGAVSSISDFTKVAFDSFQRKQLNSIISAAIQYMNGSYFQKHHHIGASILNVIHGILEYLVENQRYAYLSIDPDTYLFHVTEGAIDSAVKTAIQNNDIDHLLAIYREMMMIDQGYEAHDRGIFGAMKTMSILRNKSA